MRVRVPPFIAQGRYVLLSDSRADGQFMVHHFLTQALKGESPVYMLTHSMSDLSQHTM